MGIRVKVDIEELVKSMQSVKLDQKIGEEAVLFNEGVDAAIAAIIAIPMIKDFLHPPDPTDDWRDLITKFHLGQLELTSKGDGGRYRGQIVNMTRTMARHVPSDYIEIQFDYLLKWDAAKPGYVKIESNKLEINLLAASAPGDMGEGRIAVSTPESMVIFYPPDYKRYLDKDGNIVNRGT